jgi:Zn-dependent protease with chaperone function
MTSIRRTKLLSHFTIVAAQIILLCALSLLIPAGQAQAGLGKSLEKSVGRDSYNSIERQYGFVDHPLVQDYIDALGKRLQAVNARGGDFDFTYRAVKTDEVNAFAAPGGHIFVTAGLLDRADTEDEIIGVMAHEMGHIEGKHTLKQLETSFLFGLSAYVIARNTNKDVGLAAALLGNLALLHYSREDEYDADHRGLHFVSELGYDPDGMIDFFVKVEKEHPTGEMSHLRVALSTHPKTTNRIGELEGDEYYKLGKDAPYTLEVANNYFSRGIYARSIPVYRKYLHMVGEDKADANVFENLAVAAAVVGDDSLALYASKRLPAGSSAAGKVTALLGEEHLQGMPPEQRSDAIAALKERLAGTREEIPQTLSPNSFHSDADYKNYLDSLARLEEFKALADTTIAFYGGIIDDLESDQKWIGLWAARHAIEPRAGGVFLQDLDGLLNGAERGIDRANALRDSLGRELKLLNRYGRWRATSGTDDAVKSLVDARNFSVEDKLKYDADFVNLFYYSSGNALRPLILGDVSRRLRVTPEQLEGKAGVKLGLGTGIIELIDDPSYLKTEEASAIKGEIDGTGLVRKGAPQRYSGRGLVMHFIKSDIVQGYVNYVPGG